MEYKSIAPNTGGVGETNVAITNGLCCGVSYVQKWGKDTIVVDVIFKKADGTPKSSIRKTQDVYRYAGAKVETKTLVLYDVDPITKYVPGLEVGDLVVVKCGTLPQREFTAIQLASHP